MNEKLQKIYYILGIVQRITMIILTVCMMKVAYQIYDLLIQSTVMLHMYGKDISDIHKIVDTIKMLMVKSWFF